MDPTDSGTVPGFGPLIYCSSSNSTLHCQVWLIPEFLAWVDLLPGDADVPAALPLALSAQPSGRGPSGRAGGR